MSVSLPAVARVIEDGDCWRGAPPGDAPATPYKEWHHFVIFGDRWTLLFNLNIDGGAGARVIAIAEHEGWHAEVTPCARPRVRPGRLDATFDRAGMRWTSERYEIWRHGARIALECTLQPASIPSLSHHIALGPGAHLSWCLVPRLIASGWFELGGCRVRFERRLAYHDHNWGRFAWGGDFAWDWGCAMPDDVESPWTVIFARMSDRSRRRTTATSVFLLEDGRHVRYFRNAEVQIETEGRMGPRPAVRVPPAAALLVPDADDGVPLHTRFAARRDDEWINGTAEGRTRGQVLIPSELELGRVVRLNEAHTRMRIEGRCAGKPVRLEGPGILEVLRA